MRARRGVWLAAAAFVLSAGCGAKRFVPPTGAGTPIVDAASMWQELALRCRSVRTLTAEIALSGRAGGTRLHGRLQAGFAPGSIRLEGVAPFGQPVFILVGTPPGATLLLPRDDRVVKTSDAAEILEALVGARLQADTLRAVLAGCVTTGTPISATEYDLLDLVRFDFAGSVVFAEQTMDGLRVVAGEEQSFLVEYLATTGIWPRRVRISRDLGASDAVDLTLEVSQREINVDLPDAAFTIDVPPDALPMTLAELRQAGPLGARN